ncbi:MAG: glutamine--fructose-6-phosphate transaminase (isomerizing) [Candidatus Scatovivens sp.]
MCGIVGYIGSKKAEPILIDGLLRLEYRGYDSVGIATLENNEIKLVKTKGRVKNLADNEDAKKLNGTIGIGHTRWATHGKPSVTNSHPHLDNSNSIAVVHNGIIENYSDLKLLLVQNGYKFLSDTDTEVIPNLIDFNFKKFDNKSSTNFITAVKQACDMLQGSYAICVVSEYIPDSIIVIRKDSPLVIGKGKLENYIASDIPAILSYTKDFYILDDKELAVLKTDSIEFFDSNLNNITKNLQNIDWDATSSEKNGFEDYMLKEIYEQPKSIRETIGSRLLDDLSCNIEDLNLSKEYLTSINKIYIVACGTAMHAGLVSKSLFENLCNISTEVDVASEFRYRNPLIDNKTLCIYISQSGETADTIAALKLSKQKGAKTIAISNVIGSSITREADYTVYTHAGPEIAVASTKAYTCQVLLLTLIAIYFSEILEIKNEDLTEIKADILSLPNKINEVLKLDDKLKAFSHLIYAEKDMFFLGRGIDYAVAMEGSLKLKEISYIHSEAYASGELKHGPIALIENGITVISIITNQDLASKTISNIQEVVSRGAKTLVITNQDLGNHKFDEVIQIPEINKFLSPILSVIPLQLLAYHIAKEKMLDVDKPRNLAKSVTVE